MPQTAYHRFSGLFFPGRNTVYPLLKMERLGIEEILFDLRIITVYVA
jgi:hypothetical protein